MVDGGEHIQLAEWKTVSNILHKVGIFVDVCVCVCVCVFSNGFMNFRFISLV